MAYSISESIVEKVISYILHQEEHHRIKSYLEEYDDFIDKIGNKYLG